MKKIIIYYPFPLRNQTSGSAVRPVKMINAFKELGVKKKFELIVIYGDTKKRKALLLKLYRDVNPKDILFCYMENSTLPFWLTDDDHIPRTPFLELRMFQFLKKNDISVGLFYRDIYWKFKDEYPLKGIKRMGMKSIFTLELMLYKKYITHFFLPSYQMNAYIGFDERILSPLPPGGMNKLPNQTLNNKCELNVIYVGGISEKLGLYKMLDAIDILNQKEQKVILHLVCRKKEYEQLCGNIEQYIMKKWLNIYHAFGEELDEIYTRADVAVIPREKNKYNDFAVPVKLFEYLSYGLPIVATDCNAQAEIINEYNLGIITSDSSEDIAKGIEQFFNKGVLNCYRTNVREALLNGHLWNHRAESVYKILMKEWK